MPRIERNILFFVAGLSTLLFSFPWHATGQSNRHWTRSFNEESSLLSGAVVGGGVGPSAIYYNPAAIADVKNSSLSFHASLVSFDFYKIKNSLGDQIDLSSTKAVIQPRFISYLIHPRKDDSWSLEFAFLNNEISRYEFNTTVDETKDVLKNLPGEERYHANYQYYNDYRDDWVGMGASKKVSNRLFLGASMFAQIKSMRYKNILDLECFPLNDTIILDGEPVPFYSAAYQETVNVHFNNYRLVWKFAMLYKWDRWSFGVTFRTPSLNLYSDGKKVGHKEKLSNITAPGGSDFLPNYVLVDFQQQSDVSVNYKDPFSIAVGLTVLSADKKRTLFTTLEFFGGLDPYPMIFADARTEPFEQIVNEGPDPEYWLYFGYGARPVLNAAIGYRIEFRKKLQLLGGFRTDFNYMKGISEDIRTVYHMVNKINLNVYHLTGGVRANVLGQDLIAGFQYSLGYRKNIEQVANLADPVEYNETLGKPLQGDLSNNMHAFYNSISIYFGATLNFGVNKDQE